MNEQAPQQPQMIEAPDWLPPAPAAPAATDRIRIENPGPLTLRTAIGSPHAPIYGANVHGGPVQAEAGVEAVAVTPAAEAAGEAAMTGAVEQVADAPSEAPVETTPAAAVRPAANSGQRNGRSYMPLGAATQPQIDAAASRGFDLKAQDKYSPYSAAKRDADNSK